MVIQDILKELNNNYANILSLFSSIVMILVTGIYVVFTYRQAKYAKQSLDAVQKQFRAERQPCVVPSISCATGTSWDTGEYIRRQLGVSIDLENAGDSPALTVFVIASLSINFPPENWDRTIPLYAAHGPDYLQVIPPNAKASARIIFENSELIPLYKSLETAMKLNLERIQVSPSKHAYRGAQVIIQTFYKNVLGQWYESKLTREISWFISKDKRPSHSNNLNEFTYPPLLPDTGEHVEAQFISPRMSPLSVNMVSEDYVLSVLSEFIEDNPWIPHSEDNVARL